MIKTGLQLTPGTWGADLIKLLSKHPDVIIKWVKLPGNQSESLSSAYDSLQGEVADIPSAADYNAIDLYIGPDFNSLDQYLGSRPTTKAILIGQGQRPLGQSDGALAVCEFNRKALVRGARVALMPDTVTLLGALALMPLAKNLLLNQTISGTMMLPTKDGAFRLNAATLPPVAFRTLREEILEKLQTSFCSSFEISAIDNGQSTFACALLTIDTRMALDQARKIYSDFYSDHRHIVFPTKAINNKMVEGTNKTVIGLGHDGQGRLLVTVGFDARFKAASGNILHTLNLINGLDELTGF